MNDPQRPEPAPDRTGDVNHLVPALARMFAEAWAVFIDGGSIDGFELQDLIEKTGLAEWRPCTEEEAASMDCDIATGDQALFLTDDGKRILRQGMRVMAGLAQRITD